MIEELIEFLLYLIFPALKRKKRIIRKSEEWFGVVEKREVKSNYSTSKYECFVVFRTEEGESVKISVNEADYNKYEEGKRYQKKSGEDLPVLVTVSVP